VLRLRCRIFGGATLVGLEIGRRGHWVFPSWVSVLETRRSGACSVTAAIDHQDLAGDVGAAVIAT